MVDKERVRLLVDALRSGEYEQGKNHLEQYDPDTEKTKHCCLGVACRVAMAHGLELKTSVDDDNFTVFGETNEVLPESVKQWYGFDNYDPYIYTDKYGRIRTAASCNDALNFRFGEIASLFEETFLKG